MNAQDVILAWDLAGEIDTAQAAIHPSGVNAALYEASGKQAAADLTDMFEAGTFTVADFGCGDGRVARWLTDDFDVVGIDASPAMLERFVDAMPKGTRHILTDGLSDDLDGSGFDAVYALAVFIHHDHATGAQLLRSLRESVRPGGLVLADIPVYAKERERGSWCDVTVWTEAMLREVAHDCELEVEALHVNAGQFSFEQPGPNHGIPHRFRRPA